jgi:hypothetical protein
VHAIIQFPFLSYFLSKNLFLKCKTYCHHNFIWNSSLGNRHTRQRRFS